jgi:hypothetical protein
VFAGIDGKIQDSSHAAAQQRGGADKFTLTEDISLYHAVYIERTSR